MWLFLSMVAIAEGPAEQTEQTEQTDQTDQTDQAVPPPETQIDRPPPALVVQPALQQTATPVVQIVARQGQRFSVILDGKPMGVASHDAPLVLTGLTLGQHLAEFRTEDNTVIWARGVLDLQPAEELVLALSEGRPVIPTGRAGAWRATNTSTPLPRKPARQPVREAP